MSMSNQRAKTDSIDAALARLPAWDPPPDFAARTAALASEQMAARSARVRRVADSSYGWMAPLLRALGLAACVSVGAWLGGELLFAVLQAGMKGQPAVLGWVLALGSVLLAWRYVRRLRLLA